MILVLIVVVGLIGFVFFGWYRPWQLKWGTTPEEVDRVLPGDEVVLSPTFNATRAVAVDAPPEAIWPWIVQIGFGRAGWYTYDLLDNLGRHSAESVVPELQHMDVGNLVPMGPGEDAGMRVKGFEPNEWMLWWDNNHLTTWAWVLDPTSDGGTRLVTRIRSRPAWRHPSTIFWLLLFEAADFPLMRKCLLGIKRRAETLASTTAVETQDEEPTLTV